VTVFQESSLYICVPDDKSLNGPEYVTRKKLKGVEFNNSGDDTVVLPKVHTIWLFGKNPLKVTLL
jgi:hypothetical protein